MISENEYYLLIICLYLKGYLNDSEFEQLVIDNYAQLEKELTSDIFMDLISTNLDIKVNKISICTRLHNYANQNFPKLYDGVNDAYVERLISSDIKYKIQAEIVKILNQQFIQPEISMIDCKSINSRDELINAVKRSLGFPAHCGNNWNAVQDFIRDIIPPKKLVVINIQSLETKLPMETDILRNILSLIDEKECVVKYS